jgi:hypothetical protein
VKPPISPKLQHVDGRSCSVHPFPTVNPMRVLLLTAFVVIIFPAAVSAQSTQSARLGVSSVQAGAPTSMLEPIVASQFRAASTGGHRHTGRGAVLGLVAGAIGGVVYGRLANPGSMGRGYNEIVGAIGFGAIGAVCGAVIGYAWRSN